MLIDPYKRPVNYLRVSVTDRCDFRCQYCMAENMKFLPKKDLLTLDELERICISFIDLGTKKNKNNRRRTFSKKKCYVTI
ncbi:MAG: hypothetical protein CM15mP56_3510 [Alphaproteobacteria bacterium]|nr:MAG: hypothetical protein CM15mP56_3510 [Alphaproteobacteria bacterium]